MIEKLKNIFVNLRSNITTKSGLVGLIVVMLGVLGLDVSSIQIEGIVSAASTVYESWEQFALILVGTYEAVRKEK